MEGGEGVPGPGSRLGNNSRDRGEGEDGGCVCAGEGAFLLTLAADGRGCLVLLSKDRDLDSGSWW